MLYATVDINLMLCKHFLEQLRAILQLRNGKGIPGTVPVS